LKRENIKEDENDERPSTTFAFLNVSNPSESLSVENRKKVRQHVRYQVTAEVKAARQSHIKQAKRRGTPRAPVLETGETPFINVSHPSQIAAPHLITFVRQQAQRKLKKERPARRLLENGEETGDFAEEECETVVMQVPENQREFLDRMFKRSSSPATLNMTHASTM